MSTVMKLIRDQFKLTNESSIAMGDLVKRLNKKGSSLPRQIAKEDLAEILDYYKRMQVIHVDDEEQVMIL